MYLFPFLFAAGCKLPYSLLLSCSHVKTICPYVAKNQTNNHDVILINTFCLQICNWQRQSSVASVNRTLLPKWILQLSLSADIVVSTLAFQSRHPWFKSGSGYLFIVFVDFIFFSFLLCDLIFIHVAILCLE